MTQRMSARLTALAAGLALVLASSPALAHWCNCLWASGYNLVVRPAQDTVTVPTSGPATLDIFVQNNMGYPLLNFVLNAKATGYTVSVTGPAPKVANYLMPGEKLKKTLSITKTGGGTLAAQAIDFYVTFGEVDKSPPQHSMYGNHASPHNAVVMRKSDGSVVGPNGAASPLPGIGQGDSDQGLHLQSIAIADFGTTSTGIDALMEEYCAGRGSWDAGGGPALVAQHCQGTQVQTCPAGMTRNGLTKYEAQHLWSAPALVGRKNALGAARTTALRARLQCGWNDVMPAAKYMAAFALGYLGEDAGARTFLKGIIDGSGSAGDKLVAKASLLLLGNAADKATYGADVTAGLTNADTYVASVCAGALGIVNRDDKAVSDVLLAKARWVCPGSCDTPDDAKPFFAAHILSIVSWDRRGYAPNAADTGDPSYFGTGPADTVAPKAPAGLTCTRGANGALQVKWTAVTLGVDNNPEASVAYRVYWDNAAHASCTKPGDAGCNYAHLDPATAIYRDYTSTDGTKTYYFRVTAVDGSANESAFSTEVSCVPQYAPTAALTCNPATGSVPPTLNVTCDASASADKNGAADIATYAYKLDAEAEATGTAKTRQYTFDAAGGHVVQLTVTDSTGLTATATASITVSAGNNQPPVAKAAGTPLTGPAPLAVQFSSTGSSDPEATTLSYSWDFGDGTAKDTTAGPSHSYATPGTYTATLTVTDSGTPAASSTAVLTIVVKGNRGPDVSTASATPTAGPQPLKVHFDATGVTDPEGDAVTLTWDFGDGSAASHERSVDHTYATKGVYTAKLSAQDDGKPTVAPAEASFTISVGQANLAPDCAHATVTPAEGGAPLKVTMDATGCTDPEAGKLSFEWRVPPSSVYATATAEHTFTAAGQTTISLIAKDDGAPQMESTWEFPIIITGGSSGSPDAGGTQQTIEASCGCSSSAAAPSLLGLVLVGLALRRRR